jgi:hypothetical protein
MTLLHQTLMLRRIFIGAAILFLLAATLPNRSRRFPLKKRN